jgi:hypothetical protein
MMIILVLRPVRRAVCLDPQHTALGGRGGEERGGVERGVEESVPRGEGG